LLPQRVGNKKAYCHPLAAPLDAGLARATMKTFTALAAFTALSQVAAFAPARPTTALAPCATRGAVVLMAVPKSRTSKKKTRQRKANWFAKANIQRERALTLGRSVLSEGEGSFIYNPDEADDDDDDEFEDDEDEEEEEEDDEEDADGE